MEYFTNYKLVRNAAWKCLVDCQVSQLPVKVSDIAKKIGAQVISYANGQQIISTLDLNSVAKRNDGFCLWIDRWYILYNQDKTPQCIRLTIAHELGHILMKHSESQPKKRKCISFWNSNYFPGNMIENEANLFATRLLAPVCVLKAIKASAPKRIAALCEITYPYAWISAIYILLPKSPRLKNSLERRVFQQFEEYIITTKQKLTD